MEKKNKHASIEQVNNRLDVSFGFERRYIRSIKKITKRREWALNVMLPIALGWIMEKQPEKIKSFEWSPIKAGLFNRFEQNNVIKKQNQWIVTYRITNKNKKSFYLSVKSNIKPQIIKK